MMVVHTKRAGHGPSVECPFANCGLTFTCFRALWMHKRGPAHAGEGGTAVCRKCSATFATVAEYTAHVREHRRGIIMGGQITI